VSKPRPLLRPGFFFALVIRRYGCRSQPQAGSTQQPIFDPVTRPGCCLDAGRTGVADGSSGGLTYPPIWVKVTHIRHVEICFLSPQSRHAALDAVQKLLLPLAGFMLRFGVSFREFSDLSKQAFVAAATRDFGLNGRPTNVSRVSLLTGIARKEVRRQRKMLEESDPLPPGKTSDATRVLSGWYQDPDFRIDGKPAALDDSAYTKLCQRYCSEVPVSVTRKELERVGAVSVDERGHYVVHNRYFRPAQSDPEWLLNAGSYLGELSETLNYNIDSGDEGRTRFLGRAIEPRIPLDAVESFHEFLEAEGQQFLEAVDAWLVAHDADGAPDTDAKTVRLGVGVFAIGGSKS